jgi:hypothetical protein
MTGTNKPVLLGHHRRVMPVARHANELEVDSSGKVPSNHVRTVIARAKNHCESEAIKLGAFWFLAGQAKVHCMVFIHHQQLCSTDEGRERKVFEEN